MNLRCGIALWLLIVLALGLLRQPFTASPPTATPTTGWVVFYNASPDTVSVWTLSAAPDCVLCPATPLAPGATQTVAVAPGPHTWEVLAVPYGDLYTAYRLETVAAVVQPGVTLPLTLTRRTEQP